MALCVFALIASEFMPVSLLTPIATDLRVSEGVAGQAIAVSGASAVLTSLLLPALARRMDRKTILLCMTASMAVSGALIASAQGLVMYMMGRVLIGVSVGGFWSMSAATAIQLVPAPKVSRALAIFNGGNALATVIAAPLGSFIGSLVGWRGAFFGLVPVAVLAFAGQWASLPSMRADAPAPGSRNALRLLADPLVLLGMAAVGLFFMGQFALFTYVRPFLETTTNANASTLSLVLLAIGVAGFIGTAVIGWFLSRNLYRTLVAIPLAMAAVAVALVLFGEQTAAAVGLLAVWGLLATAAPVGWWSWLATTLPESAEAGGGLMVAVVQLAIALGSTVGGVLFDASGYARTFGFSALLLVSAAALALTTAYRSRRVA
ncbi:MFS transporter [Pararobbsia alpina]|uniref:Purine ribonucleoside efflux pump NepI n=1 Tax=Pararobbsia alpina TaxID=621374 RepID=A0A6S7BJS6_9BURK|nr:MFS transporter [Pararobbsia alpina]CAB3802740.1 Purine ribonucleoside efflux pump NepI [Pararobbsia alpina]